jgi:thiol-disulfide isomerase/thioredoxin
VRHLLKIISCLVIALLSLNVSAVQIGQKAPSFTLPTLDGSGQLSLADYKGKVVFIDFWASWCPPCRKSLPLIDKMREELPREKFEVIAINVDEDSEDGLGFLQQVPVSYPVGADVEGAVPSKYGVMGMPTSLLIDESGVVRYIHEGFAESDMQTIRNVVKTLL